MRTIATGRKNWLFAGSQRGGRLAAPARTLIETVKLNGVDPHASVTDVLDPIVDHNIIGLDQPVALNYAYGISVTVAVYEQQISQARRSLI
jgi:transposase